MPQGGAYTPFKPNTTELARAGEDTRIPAVVNNPLSFQSIPPGVIEDSPAGPRQRYWHDFFNYAGIHRPVWLSATPTAYLSDVTVVTGLDGSTGTVEYRTEAEGTDGHGVLAVLREIGR